MVMTKSQFSRNVYAIRDRIWCNKHLRHTTTENMITMGKVDTSDFMMIITWAMSISFQSPELKWVSWAYTTPYILMTKVIERTSSMLDTLPQDKLYRRLQVFNAYTYEFPHITFRLHAPSSVHEPVLWIHDYGLHAVKLFRLKPRWLGQLGTSWLYRYWKEINPPMNRCYSVSINFAELSVLMPRINKL